MSQPNSSGEKSSFLGGILIAAMLTSAWNSQQNPPKIYSNGRRLHHGAVGLIAGLLGLILDKPTLIGFGAGLALDDQKDYKNWFS